MAPNPLGISTDFYHKHPSITAVIDTYKGFFIGNLDQRFSFEETSIELREKILGPKVIVEWRE